MTDLYNALKYPADIILAIAEEIGARRGEWNRNPVASDAEDCSSASILCLKNPHPLCCRNR